MLDTLRRLAGSESDPVRCKEREEDPVWASDPDMEQVFEELPEACKLEMKTVGDAAPPMFPFFDVVGAGVFLPGEKGVKLSRFDSLGPSPKESKP